MSTNNSILTRVFTQNTLKNFINCPSDVSILSSIVKRYEISYDDGTNNESVISEIYQYLGTSYRNEYFYKNTLLNKLIISAHRLKTTTALTEVPVAKSKADFIMINGKAVVYEIKTELDTFERLESQIADYYKAFDHVCVVTSVAQSKELMEKLVDTPVGIYVLTEKNTIKHLKEPEKFDEQLDKEQIFKILNKPEYENIVRQINKSLPSVTPVNYYRECKKIACKLPIEKLYELCLKELKKRNKIDIVDFDTVPYALRFLVYFSKFNKTQIKSLNEYLNKTFEGVK
ncbi:MAG: sce7726 family protein [Clostridia bacterium]|nr:sce7726 family protein [Clostridia bacterium]